MSRPINVARYRAAVQITDLVLQEIGGTLCCHFRSGHWMADTAAHTDTTHNAWSALRITRQSIAHQGDFSLTTLDAAHRSWLTFHAGRRTPEPRQTSQKQPPRRQTQIHQMARQTSTPPALAQPAGPPTHTPVRTN